MKSGRNIFSPFILPIASFAMAIFIGAALLSLPIVANVPVKLIDALFIATSAVCVTGLAPFDAFEVFNLGGQFIILVLMQLGGIGIITLTTLAGLLIKRRVAISERIAVGQGLFYDPKFSLRHFLLRVTVLVFSIELIGAVIIWLSCPGNQSLFNSIFLSVSAFCNAGFAPWGDSLERFRNAYIFNIAIMMLIILGGLGFFVLDEITKKFGYWMRLKRAPTSSFYGKLVLHTTFWLIFGGAMTIFCLGCINPAFSDFTLSDRLCSAFFESVTSRTAGFASLNQANFSSAALLLVIFLMFIGGSPGSCAGGIKTTTFRVLAAFLLANLKGRSQVSTRERAFGKAVVNKALLLLAFSLHIVFAASFVILLIEQGAAPHGQSKPFFDIFFEVVSAFCTVGLSVNLTPLLADESKLVLCILMFVGKMGPIWLITAVQDFQKPVTYRYPEENLPVG